MIRSNLSRRLPKRHGVAFLLMVVMVSLVVLGATQSLLRNEVERRRASGDRMRAQAMQAGIDAVVQAQLDLREPIRLPLDPSPGGSSPGGSSNSDPAEDQYLEIRRFGARDGAAGPETIAVDWIRRGEVIDQATRTIE